MKKLLRFIIAGAIVLTCCLVVSAQTAASTKPTSASASASATIVGAETNGIEPGVEPGVEPGIEPGAMPMTFLAASSVVKPRWVNPFSDVKSTDWFYEYVAAAHANGLMVGTSPTMFSPDASMTRAMFARILANLERVDFSAYTTSRFTDVPVGQWYTSAIEWAADKSIVSGIGNNKFDPDADITREQMAVMLYNYIEFKNISLPAIQAAAAFADESSVSLWAIGAVRAIKSAGIITGKPGNLYDPKTTASRAEVATIFARFLDYIADDIQDPEDKNLEDNNNKPANNNTGTPDPGSGDQGAGTPSGSDSGAQGAGTSSGGSSGNPSIPVGNEVKNTYPTLSVSNVSVKPGGNVQVVVRLDNNPGVLGMALTMYYDETACVLQSVESGEAFRGVLELTTSKTLSSGGRFIWDGVDISQSDIKDGPILLANFSIPQGTNAGKYPITIKYSEGDIVDKELASVSPLIENGYITVTTN